mmetsp:Transcript_45/g.139  ORF Transcript_45/g.139 Transcript_45/m.139 type:complete len:453 (+) Transcript_45:73-1431(+)
MRRLSSPRPRAGAKAIGNLGAVSHEARSDAACARRLDEATHLCADERARHASRRLRGEAKCAADPRRQERGQVRHAEVRHSKEQYVLGLAVHLPLLLEGAEDPLRAPRLGVEPLAGVEHLEGHLGELAALPEVRGRGVARGVRGEELGPVRREHQLFPERSGQPVDSGVEDSTGEDGIGAAGSCEEGRRPTHGVAEKRYLARVHPPVQSELELCGLSAPPVRPVRAGAHIRSASAERARAPCRSDELRGTLIHLDAAREKVFGVGQEILGKGVAHHRAVGEAGEGAGAVRVLNREDNPAARRHVAAHAHIQLRGAVEAVTEDRRGEELARGRIGKGRLRRHRAVHEAKVLHDEAKREGVEWPRASKGGERPAVPHTLGTEEAGLRPLTGDARVIHAYEDLLAVHGEVRADAPHAPLARDSRQLRGLRHPKYKAQGDEQERPGRVNPEARGLQ